MKALYVKLKNWWLLAIATCLALLFLYGALNSLWHNWSSFLSR